MRATPLRSGFQAIVVLRIYTASVFRRRFALCVTCAGLVSLLKFYNVKFKFAMVLQQGAFNLDGY